MGAFDISLLCESIAALEVGESARRDLWEDSFEDDRVRYVDNSLEARDAINKVRCDRK